MADFMAEVSEQRAIGLVQTLPALLAYRVVGFGEVDPDHAIIVPGQHAGSRRIERIRQEFEDDAGRVLRLLDHRQAERIQAV